jgi:predicted amidohydrolase
MDRAKTTVRAAAVQHAPVVLDRDRTVEKGVRLIGEAAQAGADLVVFPETWIPCYPLWVYGGGFHSPGMKAAYARLLDNSVEVPSAATDALCAAARRHHVQVVMGLNERATDAGGTIFNSLLYIGPDGEILGVHRKVMPTSAERTLWGQGDGSTLHVFDTPLGRLGGLICWEHWMPLARFAMHARREEIHVAAWPEMPEIHQMAARTYAFEGRCFVVCAGQYLARSMMPEDFEAPAAIEALADVYSPDPDVLLPGGSGIIGPDGRWIAGPAGDEETIVLGDLDLSLLAGEYQALDSAGHYNRPDIFRLSVDTRARPGIVWGGEPAEEDPARVRGPQAP